MIHNSDRAKFSDNLVTGSISLLAVLSFSVMFVFRQVGQFDFWWWMSSNLVIILSLAFIFDKENLHQLKEDVAASFVKKILKGLFFALMLFVVFYFGDIIIRYVIAAAGEGIAQVYGFKQEAPAWRIALLMLLIIGPGEELFWRGFLQRHLQMKLGSNTGFLVATALYTAVHIFTGNMVLVLAALTCGLFWGWLYKKYNSMTINIVSHTVWDIMVFILLPFN
jgi:membrane protease YdiL (CAAX protease family)